MVIGLVVADVGQSIKSAFELCPVGRCAGVIVFRLFAFPCFVVAACGLRIESPVRLRRQNLLGCSQECNDLPAAHLRQIGDGSLLGFSAEPLVRLASLRMNAIRDELLAVAEDFHSRFATVRLHIFVSVEFGERLGGASLGT
jgi:hypothetical protein